MTIQHPPLHTIDGATLMAKPFVPLPFIVDTLLSQGLHILAGSPKVGKSWLALWLSVQVAKGEAVWGVRYITASYYGGSRDVFQKMGDLITTSLTSSIPPKITKDSLVGSGIALDED